MITFCDPPQISWSSKVFPKEQAVVSSLIRETITSVASSFKRRIDKYVLSSEKSLGDLIRSVLSLVTTKPLWYFGKLCKDRSKQHPCKLW